MKRPAPPNTEMLPVDYSILEPVRVRINDELIGLGVGDIVTVLEPVAQYLITSYERLERIPLADGRFIDNPPDLVIKAKRLGLTKHREELMRELKNYAIR